jgi:hypothetical protein
MFWKPSIGKQTVRIVPFKYNKDNPFTEMKFYYGIGSKKVMASPLIGEKKILLWNLLNNFVKANDKENWRLAKKLRC